MISIDWADNLKTALGGTGTVANPNLDSATKSPCGLQDANVMEFWTEPKDSMITSAGEIVTFKAFARYSNGNTVDVTSKSTWVSMSPIIVMIPTAGTPWIMTAGLAVGQTTATTKVFASFKGFTSTINVTVCEGIGDTVMDILFVVDASEENDFFIDYLDELKSFVTSNKSKLASDQVRIGITASAGLYVEGSDGDGPISAEIVQPLSSSSDEISTAITQLSVLNRNTSLESGVDMAVAELASDRHRLSAESVIIVLSCETSKIGRAGLVESEGVLTEPFTKSALDADIKCGFYWIRFTGPTSIGSGQVPVWPDPTFCYVYSLNATKCTAFLWDADRKGNARSASAYHNLIKSIKGHLSYAITQLKNEAEYCQYNVS